jgi:CheY-like chemotaxis protein
VVHKVLLVDPDVEALSTLAQALRRRGLKVQIASNTQMACDRAKETRFDVVLAWHELAEAPLDALGLLDALAVETGRVPPFLLLVADPTLPRRKEQVLRTDVEAIYGRLAALNPAPPSTSRVVAAAPLPPPSSPSAPAIASEHGESRDSREPSERRMRASSLPPSVLTGGLAGTPLRDLLAALGLEMRTGTLTVTTPQGAGELRLEDGELVDAVYLRLEGMKAVSRLLGEHEGSFSFSPRTPAVMRRINAPLAELLSSCEDHYTRAKTARAALASLENKALFASDTVSGGPPSGELSDLARTILSRLRSPATMDEVLEELPAPDADILLALRELDVAGRLKRLTHEGDRVPVASADALPTLRALASRAKAPGFDGAARVVFAGTPGRLAVVAHSALGLEGAIGAPDGQPTVPVPYLMAQLALGDEISLDLVALPLVPAYAPMWPMALAGAAVVVRLDDAAALALADACAAIDLPIVDAAVIVPSFDEGSASLVASAVRAALEGLG